VLRILLPLALLFAPLAPAAAQAPAEPAEGASTGFSEGLHEVGTTAVKLWSFEITRSDDQAVTLGKVVIAVLTFAIGMMIARAVTHRLGSRVLHRVGVDEGASHAYQSLAYYALLAIAFLLALRAVSIPLTAFAVVGGALAIGVGFGSQNIVNNFISGVILLAERPIKKGDLVQVEQTYGNVERIGLRSTRVRTGDNIHVIVPNSSFLETNVTNWTHNDPQVRLRISVGVAYGSPTREVERLIRQAIEEHESVLESPSPVVLFMDFGSDSLEFDALFWVRVRAMMDRMKVESDLRYRIDDLFREAGIVIAFPQRDVHFDTAAPIPVRLMTDPKPGDPEATS
jgi:small-conductance mechanosensitive channel